MLWYGLRRPTEGARPAWRNASGPETGPKNRPEKRPLNRPGA